MTSAQKWLQGLQLASAATNLVGGVGNLVYPGGVAAAIGDSFGGPETGEDFAARLSEANARLRARSEAAAGFEPEWGAPAAAPTPVRPVAPAPAPTVRREVVKKFPVSGTQAHRDLDKTVGLTMPEREKQHPSAIAGRRYEYEVPVAAPTSLEPAAAAPTAPEPTAAAPREETYARFQEAAERAHAAGNADEFEQWSARALLERTLVIPDLPLEVRMYLEGVQTRQKGQALREGEGGTRGLSAEEFKQIRPAIVTARTRGRVEELLRLATETQGTAQGIRAWRGDVKNPEMTRIEAAANAKLKEFGAFPGLDPGEVGRLGVTSARRQWWEGSVDRRDKPTVGKGQPTPRFSWETIRREFRSIKLPGQPLSSEKIDELEGKMTVSAARIMPAAKAALSSKAPLAALAALRETGLDKAHRDARQALTDARGAIQAALSSREPFYREGRDIGFGITIGALGEKETTLSGGGGQARAKAATDEVKRAARELKKVSKSGLKADLLALENDVKRLDKAREALGSDAWQSHPDLNKKRQELQQAFAALKTGKRGRVKEGDFKRLQALVAEFQALVNELK
jgi:hypothetical protein